MLRIRKTSRAAVVGMMVAGSVLLASPAQATDYTVYNHCYGGGFTGSIRVQLRVESGEMLVREVAYKINKGTNSGGNRADVRWFDRGGNGSILAMDYTGSGIQDGAWHVLRSADYVRVGGNNYADFTFDKSGYDPYCSTTRVLNP